jgi:hypothetical protein
MPVIQAHYDDSMNRAVPNQEEVKIMDIMQISRHTPEACPMVNVNNKKVTAALLPKLESLAAKHGVKFVASWTDFPAHIIYQIYETPNMEAFLTLSMEPEMMAWLGFNEVKTKVVLSLQDVKAMLKLK